MSEDEIIHLMQSHYNLNEKYQQLKQENQQLKEDLHQASISIQEMVEMDIMCPTNCDKLNKYKSILDEIREQLKLERKIALSLNKPYTLSVIDKLLNKVK